MLEIKNGGSTTSEQVKQMERNDIMTVKEELKSPLVCGETRWKSRVSNFKSL